MATESMPVALITGSNSGVGLALSVAMAKTHKVYATMRSVEKRGDLDKAASAAGVSKNIVVTCMDVNSDESVRTAFDTLFAAENGRIDVLVNNAGFSAFGAVEMIPMEGAKAQFETNFFGVIRCEKAALPSMRKQRRGKIINVTSVGGVWGQPFSSLYCASKFAVEGLSESQAALFRTFGVYVSCVEPGAIKTNFIANAKRPDFKTMPEEYKKPIATTMACYQKGGSHAQTPEEVAEVIMKEAIENPTPPFRIQTNRAIQGIFDMQLKDTTGESGAKLAKSRFLHSL